MTDEHDDGRFDLPEHFYIPVIPKTKKEIIVGKSRNEPLLAVYFEEQEAIFDVPGGTGKTEAIKLTPKEVMGKARNAGCVGLGIHSSEWDGVRVYKFNR